MASGLWTALNSSPNIINGGQLRVWSLLDCPVIAFSDFPTADSYIRETDGNITHSQIQFI